MNIETQSQTLKKIISELGSTTRLIAVSKTQSPEAVRQLARLGQRAFAENYVQEAVEKLEALSDLPLDWHFIGHLQRNKVKQVVGRFNLIHSLDRWELADEIQKAASQLGIRQKVLLEINLGGESTKAGFHFENAGEESQFLATVTERWRSLPHLELTGLMTMPPLYSDPELAAPHFRRLRGLRDQLLNRFPTCRELSMGTTQDYQIALREGSTMVRLGTLLFGPREARKDL